MSACADRREERVHAERVLGRRELLVLGALAALDTGLTAGFLASWSRLEPWQAAPITFSLLLIGGSALWVPHILRLSLLTVARRPRAMPPRPGYRVAVVTTFVPDAEPLELLERTVRALCALDYPHDTFILDEGDDVRVRALCLRLGAKHFSRKHMRQYQAPDGMFRSGTKHGNLNAWLHEIGLGAYDIVTTFDPDHVPDRRFLTSVLGYFADARVGYVQVAQAYRDLDRSLVSRGAAEETYAYHSYLQMASYALGYPVIVGGHSTHRVAALRDVGGFPCHDAEDLALTLAYRAAGVEGVYVPEILACGLQPADLRSYLRQQRRWARSVLDIKLRVQPRMLGELQLGSRVMCVLHGLSYLRLPFLGLLAVAVVAVALGSEAGVLAVSPSTLAWLAASLAASALLEAYGQRFYLCPREEAGLHVRAAALQLAKWPFALLALADVATRRRFAYSITPKALGPASRSGRVQESPPRALAPARIASSDREASLP